MWLRDRLSWSWSRGRRSREVWITSSIWRRRKSWEGLLRRPGISISRYRRIRIKNKMRSIRKGKSLGIIEWGKYRDKKGWGKLGLRGRKIFRKKREISVRKWLWDRLSLPIKMWCMIKGYLITQAVCRQEIQTQKMTIYTISLCLRIEVRFMPRQPRLVPRIEPRELLLCSSKCISNRYLAWMTCFQNLRRKSKEIKTDSQKNHTDI